MLFPLKVRDVKSIFWHVPRVFASVSSLHSNVYWSQITQQPTCELYMYIISAFYRLDRSVFPFFSSWHQHLDDSRQQLLRCVWESVSPLWLNYVFVPSDRREQSSASVWRRVCRVTRWSCSYALINTVFLWSREKLHLQPYTERCPTPQPIFFKNRRCSLSSGCGSWCLTQGGRRCTMRTKQKVRSHDAVRPIHQPVLCSINTLVVRF